MERTGGGPMPRGNVPGSQGVLHDTREGGWLSEGSIFLKIWKKREKEKEFKKIHAHVRVVYRQPKKKDATKINKLFGKKVSLITYCSLGKSW